MNEALQTLEVKVENNGTTPQGKIFAREWNVMVEAVKALDLKEFDEAKLRQFLRDNDFITSEDIPDIDSSNVVTLSGQQTISGPKDFVGGIKVNGMPITYNAELGVWEFTGDLFVTGNFAWGSSIDGFKPSTVMDAVRVDGSTIIKKKDSNGDWYLYAPGGGSGGSGGGLTLGDVVSYLSDNDYTTKTDVNSLIASSLAGYATQDWVARNYLSTGGGVLNGVLQLKSHITDANDLWLFGKSGEDVYLGNGSLGGIRQIGNNNGFFVLDTSGDGIFSGNVSCEGKRGVSAIEFNIATGASQFVGLAGNARITLGGDPYDIWLYNYGYKIHYDAQSHVFYGNIQANGSITAPSFMGNLTGNADSATNADKLDDFHSYDFARANSRILAGSDINHIGYGYPDNDCMTAGPMISFGANSTYFAEMQAYLGHNRLLYREHNSDGYGNPKTFAFTDSNVASATKLQTPRTIWGQSFDGTKDIDGAMFGVSFIQEDNYYVGNRDMGLGTTDGGLLLLAYENKPMSFFTNSQLQMHITADGNVVVGGTTADAKLHVHGTTILGGDTTISNGHLYFGAGGNWKIGTPYAVGHEVLYNYINFGAAENGIEYVSGKWTNSWDLVAHRFVTNYSDHAIDILNNGNVAIGSTIADAKLHVHGTTILGGDTTVNGNLLVNGNVSWYSLSQRSLKNIISEQGLSLAQLERIKPIKFYWKDGRDMVLHVGGVADVFAEVLPEVVARNLQDILCLNYVDAAFYVGASLIAPVLDHERRITKGEAEQEALKKENAKLKRELEEVKSKLNQLVA